MGSSVLYPAGMDYPRRKRSEARNAAPQDMVSPPRTQAFETALKDHGSMLGRIVASYEADPHLQQDLLQEVTFAIWKALPTFRGAASVRTFLARVAHNRCISHVAKAARTPKPHPVSPDLPSSAPTPEDAADRTVMQNNLLIAVRGLPLIQREVMTLALEGFSHAEIADVLGISVNNATVRFSRAKSALKAKLGRKA